MNEPNDTGRIMACFILLSALCVGVLFQQLFNDSENRKDFPTFWGGLRDGELAKVSGIKDAVFCHTGLFLSVAKSKEGAIEMAKIAINS